MKKIIVSIFISMIIIFSTFSAAMVPEYTEPSDTLLTNDDVYTQPVQIGATEPNNSIETSDGKNSSYNQPSSTLKNTDTHPNDQNNYSNDTRLNNNISKLSQGLGVLNWSSELLTNPGFETGDTTGWSNGGGGTMTVGTDCPFGTQSPYEGTYYSYWLLDGENVNAYAYQNVSLDSYASYIDASLAKINVTGWLVSDEYNVPVYDEFFMNVRFYNASDVHMSDDMYQSGGTNPVSQGSGNNVGTWAQYGIINYTIPVGARKVQVSYFIWEYIDGSSWYDAGSADNFSVQVATIDDGLNWWNNSWEYRKLITINSSQVDGNLTNFPVLIYESSDSNLVSHAQSDGDDIVFIQFSDNITQLNHEIQLFNGSTGELVAWINVTNLSSIIDTKIWMYYGNSTSINMENVTGTWDSDYDIIWHLQEVGNGTTDEYKDSSKNSCHGTGGKDDDSGGQGDVTETPDRVIGKFGYAQDFNVDGTTGDRISSQNLSSAWSAVTGSVWIYGNAAGDDRLWGKSWGGGTTDNTILMRCIGTGASTLGCRFRTDTSSTTGYQPASMENNQWIYMVLTWDGSVDDTVRIYKNGVFQGTGLLVAGNTLYPTPLHEFFTLGNVGDGAENRCFDGYIQEARMSSILRSSNWISTEYNNQNNPSTFLNFSTEQTRSNNAPYIPSNPNPVNGATSVNLDADLTWTGGDPDNDPVTYDVYFGTTSSPPKVVSNQSATSYDPGTLTSATVYYWYIVSWDDQGFSSTGPIWSFSTNYPPYVPSNPVPSDGAIGINVNADVSWTGGDPDGNPVTYDVYFGTTSSPPKVVSNQSATSYDPGTLASETTYYWRIVAWDDQGFSSTGPVWSFTTNYPPYIPNSPIPSDGANFIDLYSDVSWSGGDPDGDPVMYDVYFGTSASPPKVVSNQSATSYDPGTLASETTYYWRIVAWDDQGYSSNGPIWTFTTFKIIETSVNTISPYNVTISPLTITATGDSDLDNVTLYYRWSSDNQTWDINFSRLITIDNTSSFQGGSVSSISWTHTVGNGDNRILVVCSGVEDPGTTDYIITGADFNGTSLTKAHSTSLRSSNDYLTSTEIWYILNPNIGTYTMRINYTGTVNDCSVGAISLFNVSQESPEAVNSNTNEGPNQISTDITTLSNGSIVIDVAHCGNAQAFTQGSGQIEFFDETAASSGTAGSYKILTNAGTTTMWENVSSANRLSHVVVAFSPVSTPQGKWINNSNPDTTYPWSWNFDFPNSTGYYEFYSIGNKTGSPIELTPTIADALCHYQVTEQYTLTVNVVGNGSVTKNPDQATYTYGTIVTLTANADPGWSFSSWSGDLTGSTNPDTITMD
ncbi:MAG: DUF2341 domain-containing protein, partial [Thermoplasmatales archaeon]